MSELIIDINRIFMKNLVLIILLAVPLLFSTCKKEETITATVPPSIDFVSDEYGFQTDNIISGAPSKTMTARAVLNDDVGIKSFTISYPEWELNNTISVYEYYPDEVLNTYLMEYSFLIPADADESKNHEIALTVTNLGGLNTESQIIVILDGDYDPPVIANEFPGNNSTVPGEGLYFEFEVSDNVGLKYVVVEFPSFGFYDSITDFEDPKFLSYRKNINVQEFESYDYIIRASDHFMNQDSKSILFNVGIPQITHMFLVDKPNQQELDLGVIGTTIRMDKTEVESEHTTVYYCTVPNTEIRFMEHYNNFNSANFLYGVSGNELIEAAMDQPYIINEMGYYWITINTDLLSFEITGPISPNDLVDARTIPSPPWLYGRGVDANHGGWDTYSEYMTEDPNNEYLFHITTSLGDAEYDGYCEGCIGIELNGSTEWDDEYIWDDIVWFGYQWYQDGVIDEIDENGGKPEGWAGLAGQLETWSDDEENYWNIWTDMNATYDISMDMYTRQTRIFKKQ